MDIFSSTVMPNLTYIIYLTLFCTLIYFRHEKSPVLTTAVHVSVPNLYCTPQNGGALFVSSENLTETSKTTVCITSLLYCIVFTLLECKDIKIFRSIFFLPHIFFTRLQMEAKEFLGLMRCTILVSFST